MRISPSRIWRRLRLGSSASFAQEVKVQTFFTIESLGLLCPSFAPYLAASEPWKSNLRVYCGCSYEGLLQGPSAKVGDVMWGWGSVTENLGSAIYKSLSSTVVMQQSTYIGILPGCIPPLISFSHVTDSHL